MKKHNRWRKIYKAEGFKRNHGGDSFYSDDYGKLYSHRNGMWNAIYLGKNNLMMSQLNSYRSAMRIREAIIKLKDAVK